MSLFTTFQDVIGARTAKTLPLQELTASDTFVYTRGAGQVALMYNPTSAAISVKFQGSAPTPISPDGYGGTISTVAGKTISVPANTMVRLELDMIFAYLLGQDPVEITNGAGLLVAIYS